MKFYTIHGFFGTSRDWEEVFPHRGGPFFKTESLSITDRRWWSSSCTFATWATRLNACIRQDGEVERVLIGYSLGGRLALASFKQDPTLWSRLILVSTHPGLQTEVEREERIRTDREWLSRFEILPWEVFWGKWNSLSIFGSRDPFLRKEPLSKEVVRHHFTKFSLGEQEDFRQIFLDIPALWVVGGEDRKFVLLAQEMQKRNRQSRVVVVSGAYHRVPWERPEEWAAVLKESIPDLECYF